MKPRIPLLVLLLLATGGSTTQGRMGSFFGAIPLVTYEQRTALPINEDHPKNTDSLVIVAFGNSITATRKTVSQVFAQRLPGLLAERKIFARVINSGVPGSHTGRIADNQVHKVRHASDRFESDVLSVHPDVVIIAFGTNDSFIDSRKPDGLSRVPLDDYRKNLMYFIETLHHKNACVILIAPNPLGRGYEDFQNDRLLQYVKVVRQLAEKYQTGLVDNFRAFKDYAADTGQSIDALLLDGCHPNDKGHKIIAERLAEEIPRAIAARKNIKQRNR